MQAQQHKYIRQLVEEEPTAVFVTDDVGIERSFRQTMLDGREGDE